MPFLLILLTEYDSEERDLRYELKVVGERANGTQSARNPPSGGRGRSVLGSDDPKHREVVRFYEDSTNLLVTGVKLQPPKYLKLDEWSFTCIYTYESEKRPTELKKSEFYLCCILFPLLIHYVGLNFVLRACYDPVPDTELPITSQDQLIPSIQYMPLELDKEPLEYVEKLDFLSGPFTFAREQV